MSLDLTAKYWNLFLQSRVPLTEALKPQDVLTMLDLNEIAYRKVEEIKIFEKHPFFINDKNKSSPICQLCGNDIGNIIHQ